MDWAAKQDPDHPRIHNFRKAAEFLTSHAVQRLAIRVWADFAAQIITPSLVAIFGHCLIVGDPTARQEILLRCAVFD